MTARSKIVNLTPESVKLASDADLRHLARGRVIVAADGVSLAATEQGRTLVRDELTHRKAVRRLLTALVNVPAPTRKGRDLAVDMHRHFAEGDHARVAYLCSLLGRLAPAYDRIQERWCSEDMPDHRRARVERHEASIERRARVIIDAFPPTLDGGKVAIEFGGDPRGYTMKVVIPGAPRSGNTWGLDGRYGVPS